jgi:hypothetical protein
MRPKRTSGIFLLGLFFAWLLLTAGCNSTYKVVNIEQTTGYFPTNVEVRDSFYRIRKNVNLEQFGSVLYIRDTAACRYRAEKCYGFMEESLKKIGFSTILTKRDVRHAVVADGICDVPYHVSDKMASDWIISKHGNFLTADYYLKQGCGYDVIFDFKLINPYDGDVILFVSHRTVNFSGLDQPLLLPALNAVKMWMDDNKTRGSSRFY